MKSICVRLLVCGALGVYLLYEGYTTPIFSKFVFSCGIGCIAGILLSGWVHVFFWNPRKGDFSRRSTITILAALLSMPLVFVLQQISIRLLGGEVLPWTAYTRSLTLVVLFLYTIYKQYPYARKRQ